METKYIDIHCHVNFEAFKEDREAVIKKALLNNTWLVNIGTQINTSKKAVQIAEEFSSGVYATVGLHPIHTSASYHDTEELGEEGKEFTSRGEIFDKEKYRELAQNKKVVAIGECGLDYYHLDADSKEKQEKAFIQQIQLANEMNKPLMLHIRNNQEDLSQNAYQDTLALLKKYAEVKGVVHFFAGSLQDALDFINFGFKISFAGVITFPPRKNRRDPNYEEIIKNLPLEMLLADTDSPYVSPNPFRGQRNEPVRVSLIVKKMAEIKGLSEEQMAQIIFQNAQELFDLNS